MSASGYKQTFAGSRLSVRFAPESGHSEAQQRVGLKKRTFDVRLTSDTGRKWVAEFLSAYDPKRTLRGVYIHPRCCRILAPRPIVE